MKKVGIDFGTYNSAVCIKDSLGNIHFIAPPKSASCFARVIPTFIEFDSEGKVISYGQRAKNNLSFYPSKVIWGIKRLLGKTWQLAKQEGELNRFTYKIIEKDEGKIAVSFGAKEILIKDIAGEFLSCLYKDLNTPSEDLPYDPSSEKIEEAVISHPAYFDSFQLQELKDAALSAGFKSVEFISEPEAAALAYKDYINFSEKPLAMVVDWGAGTLDIVITRFFLGPGNLPTIVSAYPPYGDNRFGGIDIDDIIFEEVRGAYGLKDLDAKEEALWRERVEEAKIALSCEDFINKSCVHRGEFVLFTMAKDRGVLERIPELKTKKVIILEDVLRERRQDWAGKKESILERFKSHIVYSLQKNGIPAEDIDYLIPVGGPMSMPAVRKVLAEIFFGNKKVLGQLSQIEEKGFKVNPLEAVACGAAKKEKQDIPFKMIPRAYGYCTPFIDCSQPQGEILIREGSCAGIREKKPEAIIFPDTGEPIQVGLVYKEETKDGIAMYRSCYYSYRPLSNGSVKNKKVGVDIEALVTEEGTVSLNLYDLNARKDSPQATFHFSRKEEKIKNIISKPEAEEKAFEEFDRLKKEKTKEIMQEIPGISEEEAEKLLISTLVDKFNEESSRQISFSDFEKVYSEAGLFIQYYNRDEFKRQQTCATFKRLKELTSAAKIITDPSRLAQNYQLFLDLYNKLEEFRNCLEQLEGQNYEGGRHEREDASF